MKECVKNHIVDERKVPKVFKHMTKELNTRKNLKFVADVLMMYLVSVALNSIFNKSQNEIINEYYILLISLAETVVCIGFIIGFVQLKKSKKDEVKGSRSGFKMLSKDVGDNEKNFYLSCGLLLGLFLLAQADILMFDGIFLKVGLIPTVINLYLVLSSRKSKAKFVAKKERDEKRKRDYYAERRLA